MMEIFLQRDIFVDMTDYYVGARSICVKLAMTGELVFCLG